MNKDHTLEELFLAQKPRFDDREAFMTSLIERLDAVEYIKQQQEITIRRYKKTVVAAFVVGIISGVITIGLLLSIPADIPFFTFKMQTSLSQWLAMNSRLIASTALALLMTLGLICIIKNVQDIADMRTLHKEPLAYGNN